MRNIKIGVEIEFFGVTPETVVSALTERNINVEYMGYTHQVVSTWKLVTDVSVNSYGTGIRKGLELVSPILHGDEGLDELEWVLDTLNNIGAMVDKTCGVHIHHDIADYTAQNLISLHNLYYNFSKGIDSIMPQSRRASNNQYCKPLTQTTMRRVNQCTNIRDIAYATSTRYLKLNCQSYVKYGTVEFRQHSGTTDFQKLEAWIVLTQCMLHHCKNNTVNLNTSKFGSLEQLLQLLNLDGSYVGNFLIERKNTLCAA